MSKDLSAALKMIPKRFKEVIADLIRTCHEFSVMKLLPNLPTSNQSSTFIRNFIVRRILARPSWTPKMLASPTCIRPRTTWSNVFMRCLCACRVKPKKLALLRRLCGSWTKCLRSRRRERMRLRIWRWLQRSERCNKCKWIKYLNYKTRCST